MTITNYPALRRRHNQWLNHSYPPQTWTWEEWHAALISQSPSSQTPVSLATLTTVKTTTNTHRSPGSMALYDFEQRTELGHLSSATFVPKNLITDIANIAVRKNVWSPETLDDHWKDHGQGQDLVVLNATALCLQNMMQALNPKTPINALLFPGRVTCRDEYKQLLTSIILVARLPAAQGKLQYGLRSPYPPKTASLSLNIVVPRELQAQHGVTDPHPVVAALVLAGHELVNCGSSVRHIPRIMQNFAGGSVYPMIGKSEEDLFGDGYASRISLY